MLVRCSDDIASLVAPVVERIVSSRIASRIGVKDATIWGLAAQSEAEKRLGWVTSAKDSLPLVEEILELRNSFIANGINRFVLCGMGGSSLAPEVIARVSKKDLVILDSTAPEQVRSALLKLDTTAVIVSSKSGSTVETDSQKRAFEAAFKSIGINPVDRIVIVTDPNSPLDVTARGEGYRVFNADPTVGGRFSALTAFGLVPAGLAGCDIRLLLQQAETVAPVLMTDSAENPAIWLAAGLAGRAGVDKFFVESDELPGFGDWVEQLVAESTGKDGRGILPLAVTSDAPEFNLDLLDTIDVRYKSSSAEVGFDGELGELFLLWEYATAIAFWILGVNPFDQPNVESAKVASRELLENPSFDNPVDFVDQNIAVKVRGFLHQGSTVESACVALLGELLDNGYVSIHAYLPRNEMPQFEALRDRIALHAKRPVTFGWGPRFLHSTGQYHKGGPKQGVFLQLIQNQDNEELPVPGRPFTFGELISAQSNGDAEVLESTGLPVLTLKLNKPLEALELLRRLFSSN